jgi:bifunctional enzyme CysN/CysC
MIVRPQNQPMVSQDLDAMVSWMHERPLKLRGRYAIKHTTRWVRAMVKDLAYRLDVNTLHRDLGATELGLNDIGRVRFRTTQPVLHDSYSRNRTTGSFIIVDETTNETVGAGLLHGDR